MPVGGGQTFRVIPIASNGFMRQVKAYCSWRQVAGYSDADGSVHLRTDSPVVLRFGLVWVDNSFDQFLQLRIFLNRRGISIGNVLQQGNGAYSLQVASPKSCLEVAKHLAPFSFKKKAELMTMIDYYENRIDGTEAIEGFNSAVTSGLRVGKIRPIRIRTNYAEGKKRNRYRVRLR